MKIMRTHSYTVWIELDRTYFEEGDHEGVANAVEVYMDLLRVVEAPAPIGMAVVDDQQLVLTFDKERDRDRVANLVSTPERLAGEAMKKMILNLRKEDKKTDPDDIPF